MLSCLRLPPPLLSSLFLNDGQEGVQRCQPTATAIIAANPVPPPEDACPPPPRDCQGGHNRRHPNYSPRITIPHGSIIKISIVVIERIVILQEKTDGKPLTVKSLLQSRVNGTDKVPCSILCNRRMGEGVDDIPSRAQGTWLLVER
jgi:hypothetical protein